MDDDKHVALIYKAYESNRVDTGFPSISCMREAMGGNQTCLANMPHFGPVVKEGPFGRYTCLSLS